jgi:hypothetical protein
VHHRTRLVSCLGLLGAMILLAGPLAGRTALAQALRAPSPKEDKARDQGGWLAPYLDFFSTLNERRAEEGQKCRQGACADSLQCCCCDGVCRCKEACSFRACR